MARSITLFSQQHVDKAWCERREAMVKQCERIPDDQILASDLDAMSQQIAKPYCFDVPEILSDQLSWDEPDFTRGSEVAHIRWYIPIRGDHNVLGYFDRRSPLSDSHTVEFEDGHLVVAARVIREKLINSRQAADDVVSQISDYLPEIKRRLDDFNARFAKFAKSALEKRKSELLANQKAIDALSKTGIPIRKRNDEVAEAFVPPARKTVPIPAATRPGDVTPVLEMKAYDDILSTVSAMAHGIERSPQAFARMQEEDIRTVLLIGLNAIYEGQATGETFNGEGRTDILIRVRDKNIFIAECLVWDGEAKFQKKLNDQLLNYVVWRDTKAALIVFNRKKNLTSVVKTIESCLSEHPQRLRRISRPSETELRYEFRRADDPDRRFYLTCLAFDVPARPVE